MTDKNEGEDYEGLIGIIEDAQIEQNMDKEDKILTYSEIVKMSFYLGLTNFGGQQDHINSIKNKFVFENQNLKIDMFEYILELCQLLPGYSSSNLLSALCIANTKNVVAGVLGLFFYNLPSALAILFISFILSIIKINLRPKVSNYNPDAKYFSFHDEAIIYSFMALSAGIVQAALALLITSTIELSKKLSNSAFHLALVAVSGVIYYVSGGYFLFILVMIICGTFSLIKGDHNYLFSASSYDNYFDKIPFTGPICLIIFGLFFMIISSLNMLMQNSYTFLAESFLRIGSISIGGGLVIIPILFSEFGKLMEEAEVLNGYALVSLLPGTLLNIGYYSGVIMTNLLGGIIGGIMVYVPGFFFMLSAFPKMGDIKKNLSFQYFIRGANSAAAGFIFACTIKLWIDSCFVNKYTNPIYGTLNVVACFVLSELSKYNKSVVLICGALINFSAEVLNYMVKNKSLKIHLF